MEALTNVMEYLLANPLFLVPILALVAMMVYALIKKLIKLAAIVAIAGALYVVMVEYFGSGL